MDQSILIYSFVGLLFMGISIPLIKEKIKINHWYGIRLPSTMKNEKVWYETNKVGGKYLFNFGLAISLISIVLYFQNIVPVLYSFIFLSVAIFIGVIVIAVKSSIYANKISKEKNS